VTEWYPREGKRGKGHPPTRWENSIAKVARKWMRAAQDGEKWRFGDLQHWKDINVETSYK
jgi:hypothetical protein